MSGWRNWALFAGALVALCGLLLLRVAGGPMILILGLLMLVTAALEPVYGRPNGAPVGNQWRPTDERFVDPQTGKVVTVWFDTKTGERRYVDAPEEPPAAT
ncbi:MAG TPA: hypothetical protein VE968_08765 [Sphingomicrobium sp.]|nr:hypothetical protein [Sphingomicrobium sp.]